MNQKDVKMPKKTESNESHVMSIRLDKGTYERLKKISKETGVKKSKLLRTSFNNWTKLTKSPMLLNSLNIGKYFMRKILALLNENELQELSNDMGENWINILKIRLIDMEIKEDMNSLLSIFTEGLSPPLKNWFDKINYRILENGNVIIYGIHSLNRNFSLFFKFFVKYLMKEQFNYDLIEKSDNITKNTVELKFKASI